MRRRLFAIGLLAAFPAYAASPSPNVRLTLDEVHTITFQVPVATVYVGNPAIADITMIDARHAFVQGKGFGRTNIVALNRNGSQVFDAHIVVTGNDAGGTVILNRGTQRITLSCAGRVCEPTPMPGDSKDSYDAANTQSSAHENAARLAATSSESR